MSTRACISMVQDDGKVHTIYCHHDGYIRGPHGVGYKLAASYMDKEKIKALIALGDISALGNDLSDTYAYHRDRGDAWEHSRPAVYAGVEHALARETRHNGFHYVWKDGEWYLNDMEVKLAVKL